MVAHGGDRPLHRGGARHAAPRADHRGRARARARRGPPAGRAAGRGDAARGAPALAGPGRAGRGRRRAPADGAGRATPTSSTCGGCGGCCTERDTTAADAGAIAPTLLDPRDARGLPEHVRWPVVRVAGALAAGRAAVKAKASPEDVLWAIWDATGLARRWAQQSAGGGSLAAAADRDLDAVVALFDAAARFTDRLPRSSAREFADHLAAQQIPGDTLAAGAREPDAVAILTAHASKGLEWDLVCVAHVQEGSWPDLRRRGSLLGSELLVDVLAGRDTPGGPPMSLQLAEERRLFYVAVTRARTRLVVSAVSGEEEQPSRFLDELDPVEGDRPLTPPIRGVHLGALVAELRAYACDPATPAGQREHCCGRAGPVGRRRGPRRRPGPLVGPRRRCPTTGRSPGRSGRYRSARRASTPSCAARSGRCCRTSGPATASRSRPRSAPSSTRWRRRPRPRPTSPSSNGCWTSGGAASTSAPAGSPRTSGSGRAASWPGSSPGCARAATGTRWSASKWGSSPRSATR